jgi:putative transposase
MPHRQVSPLRRAIASIISAPRIRELSLSLGVVRRRRKVDVVSLVASLTLGFGMGGRRTIALLRRAYERSTGQTLAPSGFYGRLTSRLALLLKALVEEAMAKVEMNAPALRQSLGRFKQVLVADGSLLRLHNGLARDFPSVWRHYMKASAKLHVILNVSGRSAQSVRLTRGSRQDVRILKIGEWVRGKLLILDLGYSKGLLFRTIQQQGGFFLLRKKASMNPKITMGPPHFVGHHLSEVGSQMKGRVIELQGTIPWRFDRKPHRSVRHELSVRIVGSWHPEESAYRFYITNASPELIAAEHVAAVYAARWEIELFFRELKQQYRIEDLRTRKRPVVECLIYAALLTSLVSRSLRQALFSLKRPAAIERWAIVFTTFALELLNLLVLRPASGTERKLSRVLRREGIDPNKKRLPLVLRAQKGVLSAA